MLEVRCLPTAKERWDVVTKKFTAKSARARKALHRSFISMRCPKGGDVRDFLSSLTLRRNELLAAGVTISDEDFEHTAIDGIPDALATYASQLMAQAQLNGNPKEMDDIMPILLEEADRTKNLHAPKDQSQGKAGNQSDEALAVSESSNRTRRKGKCHHCGKEGRWVRECRTKKREEAAAAENQSGQASQANSSTCTSGKPENKPVGSANVVTVAYWDDGEFFMADEEVAAAHVERAKPDPPTGGLEWDDDCYVEEAFCVEHAGTEDEQDPDWAALDGWLVKEAEARDIEEVAEAVTALLKEDIVPHVEAQPVPHNALHGPAANDNPGVSRSAG